MTELSDLKQKLLPQQSFNFQLIGLSIIFIGIFCPIISAPFLGTLTYFGNGQSDGVIVFGLSIIALIFVLTNVNIGSIIMGILNLTIILATFINIELKLQSNQLIQLQWGWALLIIGSIIHLVGATKYNVKIVICSFFVAGLLSSGLIFLGHKVKQLSENNKIADSQILHKNNDPEIEKYPLNNTIPADVLKKIHYNASQQYPENYSMQEFLVNENIKAYINLENFSDKNVPRNVIEEIRKRKAQQYPDHYGMQEMLFNAEVESYKKLHH